MLQNLDFRVTSNSNDDNNVIIGIVVVKVEIVIVTIIITKCGYYLRTPYMSYVILFNYSGNSVR